MMIPLRDVAATALRRTPEVSGSAVGPGDPVADPAAPGFLRRLLRAAVVVCLAIASAPEHGARAQSAAGDPEAVSVYRKMAEALRKARSLEVVCKVHFKSAGFEADVTATLLTKEGNRMRMDVDIKGTKGGESYARSSCMVSDGSTLRVRENQEPWSEFLVAKDWNEAVLVNATRGGFPTGLELDRMKPAGQNPQKLEAIGFLPVPEPTDFVLWKKEQIGQREVLPVEFKLRSAGSAFFRENSVILWVDANTHFPVKRMNVIQSDRTLTVTENYETVSLNPPLDDSRFEIPKER